MKITTKFLKCALLLIFIGSVGASLAKAADTPEAAAKSFYQWYVKELARENGDPHKQKSIVLKAVSKRLGKWLYSKAYEEYDADYIIDAQDIDETWQVSTTKAVINGDTATLKVLLKSTRPKDVGFSQTLPLKMVRENGEWKIDSVNSRKLIV